MSDINWSISPEDQKLISAIRERLLRMGYEKGHVSELVMSIKAAHANCNPLNLDRLVKFKDFSFLHDVFGLDENVSRDTGKITGHFMPRCGLVAPAGKKEML